MRMPWQKNPSNLIPGPNATNVIYTRPVPEKPAPTLHDVMKEVYEKSGRRITSVQAYKSIGKPNGISWKNFHQEWNDMKKEADNGWF